MAYQMNNGDIAQVTIQYAQTGVEKMLNVLHYRLVSGGPIADGAVELTALAQHFASGVIVGGFGTTWKEIAANTVNIDRVEVQRIYPVRYAKVTADVAVFGIGTTEPLPPQVQGAITKRGEIATRYAVGGIRVPGIASEWEVNGRLTVGGLEKLQDLAETLKPNVTPAGGIGTWEPIILRRLNMGSSVRVTEAIAHEVTRTQRTRVPGKGI